PVEVGAGGSLYVAGQPVDDREEWCFVAEVGVHAGHPRSGDARAFPVGDLADDASGNRLLVGGGEEAGETRAENGGQVDGIRADGWHGAVSHTAGRQGAGHGHLLQPMSRNLPPSSSISRFELHCSDAQTRRRMASPCDGGLVWYSL